MSLSISLALLGYLLLAVVSILDKFIVTNDRIKPVVVTFYSTAPLVLLFLLLPFKIQPLVTPWDWIIALIAGGSFTVALLTMYIGFEKTKVSHSGPLVGAAIPFFVTFLGILLLHEHIATVHYVGVGLLIIGSLVISFVQTRRQQGWNIQSLWAVVAGFSFALSHVASKYLYDRYGFYSGFTWSRGLMGVSGLVLLLVPTVRDSFRKKSIMLGALHRQHTSAHKIIIVIIDKVLGTGAVILLQYAIALGSVTLINALTGIQYALLIILVAALSRFSPKLFHEEYAPGEIIREVIAVFIIGAGLVLLIR